MLKRHRQRTVLQLFFFSPAHPSVVGYARININSPQLNQSYPFRFDELAQPKTQLSVCTYSAMVPNDVCCGFVVAHRRSTSSRPPEGLGIYLLHKQPHMIGPTMTSGHDRWVASQGEAVNDTRHQSTNNNNNNAIASQHSHHHHTPHDNHSTNPAAPNEVNLLAIPAENDAIEEEEYHNIAGAGHTGRPHCVMRPHVARDMASRDRSEGIATTQVSQFQQRPLRSALHLSSRAGDDYDRDNNSTIEESVSKAALVAAWLRNLRHALVSWARTLYFLNADEENSFIREHHYYETMSPLVCSTLVAVVIFALALFLALGIGRVSPRYLMIMSFATAVLHVGISAYLYRIKQSETNAPNNNTTTKQHTNTNTDATGTEESAELTESSSSSSSGGDANSAGYVTTPSERAMMVSVSSMFLFFFFVAFMGKSPENCDAPDPTSCARTIRNNGALPAVYILTFAAYRLRAIVALPLMILWTIVYIIGMQTSSDLTWQLRAAAAIVVFVVCFIACVASVSADRASRRQFLSKARLKTEQRSAEELTKFYRSIAASMIPERVSQIMARGDVARIVLERSTVCCVGLFADPTRLVAERGPAVLVATIQQCALAVDSAVRRATTLDGLHAGHVLVYKGHAFGDAIELCFPQQDDQGSGVLAVSLSDDAAKLTSSVTTALPALSTRSATDKLLSSGSARRRGTSAPTASLAAFLFHLAALCRPEDASSEGIISQRRRDSSRGRNAHRLRMQQHQSPLPEGHTPEALVEARQHSQSPPLHLNESNTYLGLGGHITYRHSLRPSGAVNLCVALAFGSAIATSVKKNFSLTGDALLEARRVLHATQQCQASSPRHTAAPTKRHLSPNEGLVVSVSNALPEGVVSHLMTGVVDAPTLPMRRHPSSDDPRRRWSLPPQLCRSCYTHANDAQRSLNSFTKHSTCDSRDEGEQSPILSDDDDANAFGDGANTPSATLTTKPLTVAMLWMFFKCPQCRDGYGAMQCKDRKEDLLVDGSTVVALVDVDITHYHSTRHLVVATAAEEAARSQRQREDSAFHIPNDSITQGGGGLSVMSANSPQLILMTPLPMSLTSPLNHVGLPPRPADPLQSQRYGSTTNPLDRSAMQHPRFSSPPPHTSIHEQQQSAEEDVDALQPIIACTPWFPVYLFVSSIVEDRYQHWVGGDALHQIPLELATGGIPRHALDASVLVRSFGASTLFSTALFFCFVIDGAQGTSSSLLIVGATAVALVSTVIAVFVAQRPSTPTAVSVLHDAAVVEVSGRSLSTTSTRHHISTTHLAKGMGVVIPSTAEHNRPDPVGPYYWMLDATYFVLVLLSYALIDEQSPVADSNTVWSLGVLLLLGLRNRSAGVITSAAIDVVFMLVFIALTWATGPTTRLRKDLLSMTLPLVASFGMSAFRFAADLARRRRYLSDTKLLALQQAMQRDAGQLAHLLRQMVPDQTTDNGRLFAKLVDAVRGQPRSVSTTANEEVSAAASVARTTLARLPRLFGIRGSLFASATVDRAFLLTECCEYGIPRNERAYAVWLRTIDEALSDVPQVKLVKTDGDSAMFVDEHRLLDESCLSLLSFTAALHARHATGRRAEAVSSGQSGLLSIRCALVAGPVMAGVLGTAALSFEYYGEPIGTGRRLLGHEGDLLWTPVGGVSGRYLPSSPLALIATSRFVDWLQLALIMDAAQSSPTIPFIGGRDSEASILDRMLAISSSTFDHGAPFRVSCVRSRTMPAAEYRHSRWTLGSVPSTQSTRDHHNRQQTPRHRRRSPKDTDFGPPTAVTKPSPKQPIGELLEFSTSRRSAQLVSDVAMTLATSFHESCIMRLGASVASVRVAFRNVTIEELA